MFQRESDVVGLPGVHIECKAVERINIHAAYKQAVIEAQKRADGVPVVFHHKSREGWLVTLSLADFMKFYGGKHEPKSDDPETSSGLWTHN